MQMHNAFPLFSRTQILWSPVSNQPGEGFAVLTHGIHCSFVPIIVLIAHTERTEMQHFLVLISEEPNPKFSK